MKQNDVPGLESSLEFLGMKFYAWPSRPGQDFQLWFNRLNIGRDREEGEKKLRVENGRRGRNIYM